MGKYFIDGGVFGWVVGIIMMVGGGVGMMKLGVGEYGEIGGGRIRMRGRYGGGDGERVEEWVSEVIEENMNGVDGVM